MLAKIVPVRFFFLEVFLKKGFYKQAVCEKCLDYLK